MHIHNNSVLHYLYNMAVGLIVIYSKARAFKSVKAKSSRPRPRPRQKNPKAKAKKFGLNAKAKD